MIKEFIDPDKKYPPNAQQCLTCRTVYPMPNDDYRDRCPNCGGIEFDPVRAISSLEELAEHVDAADDTEASIARRLFKDTRCGICFHMPCSDEVSVAGYAEGVDGDCPSHELEFGHFTAQMFDAAVAVADQEGCDLFDAEHGEMEEE